MAERRPRFENLDVTATVLGVGAAILPVAGFLVRYIAFWSGLDTDIVTPLALAAQLGLLAWTGFLGLLTSIGWVVGTLVIVRLDSVAAAIQRSMPAAKRIFIDAEQLRSDLERLRRDAEQIPATEATDESAELEAALALKGRLTSLERRGDQLMRQLDELEQSADWQTTTNATDARAPQRVVAWVIRLPVGIWYGSSSLIWLGLLIFFPDWPNSLALFAAWLVWLGTITWSRRRHRRLTVPMAAALVVAVTLLSAVAAGLAGEVVGAGVASYVFKADARLPDGQYVYLGQADNFLYLNRCSTGEVVAVAEVEVAHAQLARYRPTRSGPSLWQVVTAHRKPIIGYRPDC